MSRTYKRGNFSTFKKSERVMALQMYIQHLQWGLKTGEIEDFFGANDEIEDLLVKANTSRSAMTFDMKEFTEYVKRFNTDPEYKKEVMDRIATPLKKKK